MLAAAPFSLYYVVGIFSGFVLLFVVTFAFGVSPVLRDRYGALAGSRRGRHMFAAVLCVVLGGLWNLLMGRFGLGSDFIIIGLGPAGVVGGWLARGNPDAVGRGGGVPTIAARARST